MASVGRQRENVDIRRNSFDLRRAIESRRRSIEGLRSRQIVLASIVTGSLAQLFSLAAPVFDRRDICKVNAEYSQHTTAVSATWTVVFIGITNF